MNPLILNEDENRINISEFDQNNDNKSVSLTHNQGNTSTKSTQTNQIGSDEKNEGISELPGMSITHPPPALPGVHRYYELMRQTYRLCVPRFFVLCAQSLQVATSPC